jgi:hypothetical protein
MTASPAPDLAAITQRLIVVEKELAELKQHVQQPTSQPWYLKHAGKFADDPEFQEIVRLGKEIRDADRLD